MFRKRRYPDNFTKEQVEKTVGLTPRDENNSKNMSGVPSVVTYNLPFKNLCQMIKKNFQVLYADEQVKKVFSPTLFVSFRSTRNLKSYLVRSKTYPLERKVGSGKFNIKRCLVCLNISNTLITTYFPVKYVICSM